MTDPHTRLRALDAARWRISLALTGGMVVLYFGFLALVAYWPRLLAFELTRGLTLGIVLGALVIVISWLLTWIYVHWANTRYDPGIAALDREDRSS